MTTHAQVITKRKNRSYMSEYMIQNYKSIAIIQAIDLSNQYAFGKSRFWISLDISNR